MNQILSACGGYGVRLAAACAGAAGLLVLAGCASQKPSVRTSDPAVFTMAHVRAAQSAYARAGDGDASSGSLDILDHMKRYFALKGEGEGSYEDSHLRMDAMLDGSQRASSFAQLLATRVAIEARLDAMKILKGLPDSDSDGTANDRDEKDKDSGAGNDADTQGSGGGDGDGEGEDKPEGDEETNDGEGKKNDRDGTVIVPPIDADELKELKKALTKAVEDSPFDRLDRARDFYTAYVLKIMQLYGRDSRALNQDLIGWDAEQGDTEGASPGVLPFRSVAPQLADAKATREIEEAESSKLVAVHDQAKQKVSTTEVALRKLNEELIRAQQSIADFDSAAKLVPLIDAETTEIPNVSADQLAYAKTLLEKKRTLDEARKTLLDAKQKISDEIDSLETRLQRERNQVKLAAGDQAKAEAELEKAKNYEQRLEQLSRAPQEKAPDHVDRLLLLMLQSHVDPGTVSNYMAGVRLVIESTALGGDGSVPSHWQYAVMTPNSPELVKVLWLHPSRSYDIDDQMFIEKMNDAASLLISVDAGEYGAGSVEAEKKRETQERLRFLSRINKAASFADASEHTLGWNFYPSNLQTAKRSPLDRLIGGVILQPDREFEVRGYLDAGGRDCAAYLLVPRNLTSITYRLDSVYASIDEGSTARVMKTVRGKSTTLPLPPWSEREYEALLNNPVLPMLSAQPSTPREAPPADGAAPN